MGKSTNELVFALSTVSQYGIREVIAEPAYVTPEGLRNLSMFSASDKSTHLYGFRVRAYVDRSSAIYGQRHEFTGDVDLARALAMVPVLRKVERGMDKLRDQFGYPEGFAGHLTHVASVLGISRYALRPVDDLASRWANGEFYRFVGADSLAFWTAEVERMYGRSLVAA